MIRFFLRNPLLVVVIALMAIVISAVSITKLPVDILPSFKKSSVQVLTLYPGMPAEVIEKDITSRIERWTGQSEGIERQTSKSIFGASIVRNHFREEINPNTAMSHTTSFAMSDQYYLPPGTLPPMVMPYDPTASKPLALLTVSSDVKSGKDLYDIAYFHLRNMLGGIQGIVAPAVYGGQLRRIYIYTNPDKLQAYNLSATKVLEAVKENTTMIPSGAANIGDRNYMVDAGGMIDKVEDFNDIVIKVQDGQPVYVRDIGHAADAGAIQTNIVRVNGKRQVYIPIYKRPGANTIASVNGVRNSLSDLKERLPEDVKLDVIFDQSKYVRDAISGLQTAGLGGLILVVLVLILFLGSFRYAFIVAITIPLALLIGFLGLFVMGQSINSITLGGMALAIGLLVDNAIVVLENTDRRLKLGEAPWEAALKAANEVAIPVLVSTLVIIVVFFPVVFLEGMANYLFSPLAIAVSFAMLGSYLFSMTLIPVAGAYLFRSKLPDSDEKPQSKGFFGWFSGLIEGLRNAYQNSLGWCLNRRWLVLGASALLLGGAALLGKGLGYELFPATDVGQMTIMARFEPGTRVEKTEEYVKEMEQTIQDQLGDDLRIQVSNIGVFYDWPAAYTPNSGPQDAFIKVQLKDGHQTPTSEYVQRLRKRFHQQFPGVDISFNTGGMVTAALNEGKPSPLDIQIQGDEFEVLQKIARRVRDTLKPVRGTRDVRTLQRLSQPQLDVNLDRVKAALAGVEPVDAVKNIVSGLNSSSVYKKAFWIDESNGNHYFIGVTFPEHVINDEDILGRIPALGKDDKPIQVSNFSSIERTTSPVEINHMNLTRVFDVYANVEGRDIGRVSEEVARRVNAIKQTLPKGYKMDQRGEVQKMQQSFGSLGTGLGLAVILVYLVMVPLFRSWKQPFIILFSVPFGFVGVIAILWLTNTYFSIQVLMGVIMMVGISVAYGNVLIARLNQTFAELMDLRPAILQGAADRFRPILMTMLTTVLGLLPMAIGGSSGSEANTPLARAIIGGVLAATLLTLYIIPILYSLLTSSSPKRDQTSGSMNTPTLILLVLTSVGAFTACGEADSEKTPNEASPANGGAQAATTEVQRVKVTAPEKRSLTGALRIAGTLAPNQRTTIHAMESGYVEKLYVDIGDRVKAGQTLAKLINPEVSRKLDKAKARFKAKKEVYERVKSTYEETPDLMTIDRLETAEGDFRVAKAELQALQSQVSFLTVEAPFSGVISKRFVDKGALIQKGTTEDMAQPLFELVETRPLRLQVELPEKAASRVKIGTPVEVSIPSLPNWETNAKVSRTADALDPEAKTLLVEIDLPNRGNRLKPGMYARTRFVLEAPKKVWTVPVEAIASEKQQRNYIFLVKNGRVKQEYLRLGLQNKQVAEVLDLRLDAQDKVIIQGKELVTPGQAVQTVAAESSSSDSASTQTKGGQE